MKIAMIGHKRIPSREGGIEVVVEELSTRMVAKGHQVTCYNRRGHHVSGQQFDRKREKEYKGVILKDVLTIDMKGLAAMTSSFFASICAFFGKYNVVHFHAEGPAFMCWLPKMTGKRIIVTIHGLDHQRAKWGKFARLYIMMGEKNAVRFADEIIVLSKGVQQYFLQTYNRKTIYIPNGVNCAHLASARSITEQWNLHKDDYILYVGRIVPEKGVHYLINAYMQLHTDKKLVIVGGASDTSEYFMEIQKCVSKNIIMTGFQQGSVLDELFSNAYIYCLPSDLEGMPLSLLEAMSYGNCCLVSDIDECREVVKDKAVVFERGNIYDLLQKLQMLCDDEAIVSNYRKDAADYVYKEFNWDEVTKRTIELYRG